MSVTEQFLKFALFGAEWVMYLLILCSIISVSIIFERISYYAKLKGDFGTFIQGLTERLNSNDSLEKTAAWCSGHTLLEARVAAIGLERAKDNLRSIEESMNATMIAAKLKLERGLTVLATLANNTPFIGLFGTIIGIIQAFHALGSSNSGPETVMAAIAEALVATAVGILVAIPAVMAFNFFSRVIKIKMSNCETAARILVTYFGRSTGEGN